MRKFLLKSAALLLAAFAFVALPVLAWAEEGGTVRRISGWRFNLGSSGAAATFDTWNMGFQAQWVRICGYSGSQLAYIRLSNTTTTSATGAGPSTAPVSSSNAFIIGSPGEVSERALPFQAPLSTAGSSNRGEPLCETHPWRTRGLVMHVVSGTATIDAWAW